MPAKKFSMFEGVFTPTFLSILGVIMFLRLGWVVGNVGLLATLAIIVISNTITSCTALSMSSIVTNIKVGAGGAYSMIAKSLGLQVGGAIGSPLYISQALSVAFYVTGFTECWTSVFPNHSFILVNVIAWSVLFAISSISTKLAFRIQYIIMALIGLSIVSVFMAKSTIAPASLQMVGTGDVGFWPVLAVFFPAVTGILAGASMSGELEDPAKSIPFGTILAIGCSFVIYALIAWWFAGNIDKEHLVANTSIIIEVARWRWAVIAGIMGATISSALCMFVSAPRTLLALSKHKITPMHETFSKVNDKGEPLPAMLCTAVISFVTLFLGSLNSIATLLTMFFLITYAVINISVFIEQSIGIVSFRPQVKVSLWFPFIGGAGCLALMFLINPLFSIIAIVIIIAIYTVLLRRELRKHWPDVRKGIFVHIAEQAMIIAERLPYHPKIWKPNLFIPINDAEEFQPLNSFIRAIAYPRGRVSLFTAVTEKVCELSSKGPCIDLRQQRTDELKAMADPLKEDGLFVEAKVVDCVNENTAVKIGLQTMKGTVFPPNVVLLKLPKNERKDAIVCGLFDTAKTEKMGVIVLALHERLNLGHQKYINLWVRERSPNVDMAILIALQLVKNWEGEFRLIQVVDDEESVQGAKDYLAKLCRVLRLPKETESKVLVGQFKNVIESAPLADINIFGMADKINPQWMREVSKQIGTSALFLADSPHESALA